MGGGSSRALMQGNRWLFVGENGARLSTQFAWRSREVSCLAGIQIRGACVYRPFAVADAKGSRLPRARCVARAGKGRSVHSVAGPWGTKIEHSALSDQRTPQSPAPQHPSGVRQAPRVFCGAFVFRNRAKCSSERVPFITILLKPADLCQSVGGTGSGDLRACWSQVPGPQRT